jgi:hypothetical protein
MTSSRRPTKAEARRARAEAARAALAAAERRRWMVRRGAWAAAGVALIAIVFIGIVALNRPGPPQTVEPAPTSSVGAADRTSNPPWAAPADASAAVAAAGLPMLGEEGNALHIHAHLDVIANGTPVPVPADIGVDDERHRISPLHSHETDGVIHIESPDPAATFTLGQFFSEWQLSVSADHIGGLNADDSHHLKVFVNGNLHPGDPNSLVLTAHDEIAIVYGTDAQFASVPSSYTWTNGL